MGIALPEFSGSSRDPVGRRTSRLGPKFSRVLEAHRPMGIHMMKVRQLPCFAPVRPARVRCRRSSGEFHPLPSVDSRKWKVWRLPFAFRAGKGALPTQRERLWSPERGTGNMSIRAFRVTSLPSLRKSELPMFPAPSSAGVQQVRSRSAPRFPAAPLAFLP